MKLLFGLVLVLSSLSAAATTYPILAKTGDGKVATCASVADNNRIAYRPTTYSAQITNSNLQFNTTIESIICAYNAQTSVGQWNPRKFGDPEPTAGNADISGTVILSNQAFLIMDQNDNILGTIATDDVTSQDLQFTIPVAQLLTAQDQQQLAAGQSVTHYLELFEQGTETVQTSTKTIPLGEWAGGSYVLAFTLTQSQNTLAISKVSFQ